MFNFPTRLAHVSNAFRDLNEKGYVIMTETGSVWALGTGVARTLRIVGLREVVGSNPTVSTF
jgi:hypothetical protein